MENEIFLGGMSRKRRRVRRWIHERVVTGLSRRDCCGTDRNNGIHRIRAGARRDKLTSGVATLKINDSMTAVENAFQNFKGVGIIGSGREIAPLCKILNSNQVGAMDTEDDPKQAANNLTIG